jgi:hypothetical protein
VTLAAKPVRAPLSSIPVPPSTSQRKHDLLTSYSNSVQHSIHAPSFTHYSSTSTFPQLQLITTISQSPPPVHPTQRLLYRKSLVCELETSHTSNVKHDRSYTLANNILRISCFQLSRLKPNIHHDSLYIRNQFKPTFEQRGGLRP